MTASTAQRCRYGFTLVELLLGLAIGALLVAAIGYALHASIQSVRTNTQVVDARDQVRTGMEIMMNTIRRAHTITRVDSTHLRLDLPPSETGEVWARFELSGTDLIVKNQNTPPSGAGSEGAKLLTGVKSLSFTTPPGKNAGDPYKVAISMTVSVPDRVATGQYVDVALESSCIARALLREQIAGVSN